MSPKFGFFKRKTTDDHEKKNQTNSVQAVTDNELLEMIEKEKKLLERDLITDLEPTRKSVLQCLDRLRHGADELEEQEIKVENPRFESLIKNSKRILITSIKKESFIGSSEIIDYEGTIKFKNNLEILINRFAEVGDSHNRILNEFMRKQINKLKNEFENLSSLLKDVTKILSVKESEINKSIGCRDDLILFKKKLRERKDKQDRLAELADEMTTLEKKIDASKREYDDFQRSEEFLNTTYTLEKINDKKNELAKFEKNLINMVSNLSRPITKFSYLAAKEKQRRLAILQNEPLEIFKEKSQYLQLFDELRKHVVEKSIQIKDAEKTIHQIDEIVNSLPSLSADFKNLQEELTRLESSISSKNMSLLEDMKSKIETYEKNRSESILRIDETKNSIVELDSVIKELKEKIEMTLFDLKNSRYTIIQSQT